MKLFLLIIPLFLCSCVHFPANQTFYGMGKDAKGGNKAIPLFANSGDLVGNVESGPRHLSVRLPDGPIPYAEIMRTDKKGNVFVSKVPVLPGVYNSAANASHYNGVAKIIDSTGNLILKASWPGVTKDVLGAGLGAIPK